MTKKWVKNEEGNYSFSIDNKQIGTLHFHNSMDSKATAKIQSDEFIIRRTGFWKTGIQIEYKSDVVIAKAYPERWYANTLTLDFKDNKYKLAIRNNPLAEWAIIEENKDLLAYGLNTDKNDGMVNVKITSRNENVDYILDFLLWYLFAPIATENMGDNLTFRLIIET